MPRFTDDETRVLRALIDHARTDHAHPQILVLLGAIEAKLPRADWCSHCDAEPRRYSDGTCVRCGNYLRAMGRLPDAAVLRRRQERADQKRMGA